MTKTNTRRLLIATMTLGVVFLCGPFLGAIGALIQLNKHVADGTIGDKQTLASNVINSDIVLQPVAVGLFLCPVGLLILIVCIFLWRNTLPSPENA